MKKLIFIIIFFAVLNLNAQQKDSTSRDPFCTKIEGIYISSKEKMLKFKFLISIDDERRSWINTITILLTDSNDTIRASYSLPDGLEIWEKDFARLDSTFTIHFELPEKYILNNHSEIPIKFSHIKINKTCLVHQPYLILYIHLIYRRNFWFHKIPVGFEYYFRAGGNNILSIQPEKVYFE